MIIVIIIVKQTKKLFRLLWGKVNVVYKKNEIENCEINFVFLSRVISTSKLLTLVKKSGYIENKIISGA